MVLMQQLTIQKEEGKQQRMVAEAEVRARAAAAALQAKNRARAAMTRTQIEVRHPAPVYEDKLHRHLAIQLSLMRSFSRRYRPHIP